MATNYLELILWLLSLFCGAVLSCYIAYQSTLIQDIKKLLCLNIDRKKVKWRKFMRPCGWLWSELCELSNCPFCISIYIGTIINYLLWSMTFWQSVLYSLLCIVFVEVFRKLSL